MDRPNISAPTPQHPPSITEVIRSALGTKLIAPHRSGITKQAHSHGIKAMLMMANNAQNISRAIGAYLFIPRPNVPWKIPAAKIKIKDR